MAKLNIADFYHFTSVDNLHSIDKSGLLRRHTSNEAKRINIALEKYLPQNIACPLPQPRSKCLFFYPFAKYWYAVEYEKGQFLKILVDPEIFKKDLLFVADEIMSNRVSYYIYNNVGEKLIEDKARQYWESIVPYREYIKKPLIPVDEIELLYFEDVTRQYLDIELKTKAIKKA
jgi:hypothetical protein